MGVTHNGIVIAARAAGFLHDQDPKPKFQVAYVTYSNIRGSHGLVLRRLRRRGRSLISGGMVLWMKDSTAPMSASLRLPRYAGITFRRHHLLVGRPPRRKCQEQRSRLIERSWPCSPPND